MFPDGRVCQRCGGPMEVHVDLHCQRCGWRPGESTDRGRVLSAREELARLGWEEGKTTMEFDRKITISGPIGSGKSTMARIIVGMLRANKIEVELGEMHDLDKKLLANVPNVQEEMVRLLRQPAGFIAPVTISIQDTRDVDDLVKGLLHRAELMGSRGAAVRRGKPEPKDVDYDYCVFTDEVGFKGDVKARMREVVEASNFVWHDRPNGYATISGRSLGVKMDISVHPTVKKAELLIYDDLRARGVGKITAATMLDAMQEARLRKQGEAG